MPERSDLDILADLGVEPTQAKATAHSPLEARVIAGFEDILKFREEHDRPPQHGADRDIFERLYAVRLDRLRAQPEFAHLLQPLDRFGLLSASLAVPDSAGKLDDAALLGALGVDAEPQSDITQLRHVRSSAEKRAAEEIASRQPCADFETFAPIFELMRSELDAGVRQTRPFENRSEIEPGRFFIVDGMTAYVAGGGEAYINESGNRDRRLRVIFDNGTESNLLQRSLQKALTQDSAGRRITDPDAGPLFAQESETEGEETGTIYVLQSLSDHPEIASRRSVVHKIGVTGGPVERRFTGAAKHPTFLMADVEVVATFKLFNINRTALENLLHRFFAQARLDITITDRLGQPIRPREWFVVPIDAIGQAVDRIKDGTLHRYRYAPDEGRLVQRS